MLALLPPELLVHTLHFLPPTSIAAASRACTSLYDAAGAALGSNAAPAEHAPAVSPPPREGSWLGRRSGSSWMGRTR